MKEVYVTAKEEAAKKDTSSPSSRRSIQPVLEGPEKDIGSLRDVIRNISRDGSRPSVDTISAKLSSIPTARRTSALIGLQRTHGNRYVQRVVAGIQAKLKVGQPGDIYEQEADRMAEAVMRFSARRKRQSLGEGKNQILTKTQSRQSPDLSDDLEDRLSRQKGLGSPLPVGTRTVMEEQFSVDFRAVRIHADSDASRTARAINAEAFTYGRDIYFGAGNYNLGTFAGRRLLAHELTHVVQQGKANWRGSPLPSSPLTGVTGQVAPVIQRKGDGCSTANLTGCSDEDLLTAICIGESGNIRDSDGKRGVMNVVMNRVSDSAFPSTIRAVVTAPGQFNGLNMGIRRLNASQYSDCRDLARAVMSNPADDPTLGALFFNQSCTKPCSQYCTTYLGDGSSPAHYFSRRATSAERSLCERSRGRVERHCCDHPRTRISYVTFTEAEVEPIVGQLGAEEVIQPKLLAAKLPLMIQRSCSEHSDREFYESSSRYCRDATFSPITHRGKTCFREITERSSYWECPPGDQVCFDREGNCEDSPDRASLAEAKEDDGTCNWNAWCVVKHTGVDFLPAIWEEHVARPGARALRRLEQEMFRRMFPFF